MTDQLSHTDNITPGAEGSVRKEPRCRPWIRLIPVGFVVAAAVLAAVVLLRENGSLTGAGRADPLNWAEVVITDLIQEETFNGTLGSIEDDPITTRLGGTITQIAAPGETVSQGEALFAIDDQPVVLLFGDLPAYRDIAIGEDRVTVSSQPNGTITWVAEAGAVIQQGDVLYRVDDQPVVVLYGDLPAYRNLGLGPSPELLAVQANLAAAKASLQELLALPDPDAVRIAQAQLANVEAALQQAQADYDKVAHLPNVGMLPQSLQLQAATNNHEIAKAQYQQALHGASPAQIASARALVAQAQAALDALLSGSLPADPGYDIRQLEEALVALGHDPDGTVTVDDQFTAATGEMVKAWQQDVGARVDGIVDLGELVFLPGPAQVLEVLSAPGNQAGGAVVSVATGDPASGTDVRRLEEAMVALGYDADGAIIADGIYSPETTQAILAFQAATGLEQDGIINLGEVIYLPGPVRVTNQLATKGSGVGAGSMILAISLSEKVVRVNLPANKQGVLAVGDAVIVEMPDHTEVAATVVFVSQTATPAASGPATFGVLIELDDPAVAAGLDEAPVDVIVVSDSVEDVTAIPVSALVALLEGGYAVEVDAGGGLTQLVAVDIGFFGSNNMVQITSAALQPGDRVVVP